MTGPYGGYRSWNHRGETKPRKAPHSVQRTARSDWTCDVGCGEPIYKGEPYMVVNIMRMHVECFEKRYTT